MAVAALAYPGAVMMMTAVRRWQGSVVGLQTTGGGESALQDVLVCVYTGPTGCVAKAPDCWSNSRGQPPLSTAQVAGAGCACTRKHDVCCRHNRSICSETAELSNSSVIWDRCTAQGCYISSLCCHPTGTAAAVFVPRTCSCPGCCPGTAWRRFVVVPGEMLCMIVGHH